MQFKRDRLDEKTRRYFNLLRSEKKILSLCLTDTRIFVMIEIV